MFFLSQKLTDSKQICGICIATVVSRLRFDPSDFQSHHLTMPSIHVPDGYGYVVFTAGVLPSVTNLVLQTFVMKARKQFDVQYPNLYGVPGFHKMADEFNRVQRGHQHLFESLGDFRICSLIGGLQHPIAVAGAGLVWNFGALLYMLGYKDNALDVKVARMQRGGVLQPLSGLFVIGCALKYTLTLLKNN